MDEHKYENECKEAILKTLAYRSVFKYPLSFYQMATFLMSPREFSTQEIKESANKLIQESIIKRKYKKYILCKNNYVNWQHKYQHSIEVIKKNQKYFDILAKIPWIKMICVTGSVAACNAEKETDIDVLIVASKNRLWLTRGFTALILTILNKQPFGGEEVPGSICTNIFMEESQLEWEEKKQNVYTATDIVLMQPVINKGNTYFEFIRENKWIFKFYKNFVVDIAETPTRNRRPSHLINRLEDTAREIQLMYMKKKKTVEITTKHLIHFNKHDSTGKVLNNYKKVLAQLKIS